MTCQRIFSIRILCVVVLSISVQTILISSYAPAQEADNARPPAKSSPASLSWRADASAPDLLHPLPLVSRNAWRLAASGFSLSFLPFLTFDAGGFSVSIAVADVNGDGKPDLIAGTPGGDFVGAGGVSVLLGNGDGTFDPAVTYDSGGLLAKVAVADVNGDGKLDILAANRCDHYDDSCRSVVGVLLGKGDGTFQTVATYAPGGFDAQSIAVADVNRDGRPDLVVTLCEDECGFIDSLGMVAVSLGNGDGTFQAAVTYSTGGYVASSIAVADLNGDGNPDLVVANDCAQLCGTVGEGELGVLLGNGDGTFQPAVKYDSGGDNAASVDAVDVNMDKIPDLVVANACGTAGGVCLGNGAVAVLLGNGDGTFKPAVTYDSGGSGAFSETVADLDQDGKLDLIVTNTNAGTVGLLQGNGDGTFQPAVLYQSGGASPRWVTVADVNGDGKPDIAVAVGVAGVLLNNTGLALIPTATLLFSSLNPSFAGQAVTFSAFVSSTAGIPPDGGKVTFYLYGTSAVLGTGLLSAGQASVTASSLPTGTSGITAIYSGNGHFGPSMSPVLQQVVNATTKAVTSTILASSLNPSIYGQRVTLRARVSTLGSSKPRGTVNFQWSVFSIGTATVNSSGVATLIRDLNAATYPLVAVYSGDTSNLGSTSAVLHQVVEETTSAAMITASPNPSTLGQAVTFTAKVTSPTVVPTGPVTFTAGNTVLGTAQLRGGEATFETSTLVVGSTIIKATYYGDSNIAKSSASVTQTVQQ
jgi:hypothetical protein